MSTIMGSFVIIAVVLAVGGLLVDRLRSDADEAV